MPNTTQAYINWARIVCDCGYLGCSDAVEVQPGQDAAICEAGHISAVEWDPGLPAALEVLNERAEDRRKNWFPKAHPLAVATGQPHGQTVAELRDEHIQGVAADQTAREERRQRIAALLGEFNVQVSDDGKLIGDI